MLGFSKHGGGVFLNSPDIIVSVRIKSTDYSHLINILINCEYLQKERKDSDLLIK